LTGNQTDPNVELNKLILAESPTSVTRSADLKAIVDKSRYSRLFDLKRLHEPLCSCTKFHDPFPANSTKNMRAIFTDLVKKIPGSKLEIGPFVNPQLFGYDVKYFDVLNLDGLKKRAEKIEYPLGRLVKIDYVEPTGDLSVIPDKGNFSLAFSAHVVNNQLDLVTHLNSVSDLLVDGGYYLMFVPDKRYCFDHAVPESSIADILDDYYNQQQQTQAHALRSVVEHRALTQHNDPEKHWKGEHDTLDASLVAGRIRGALIEFDVARRQSSYVDVYNYQFTPQSLSMAVNILHELHISPMKVHQVYETVKGQIEFCIVLKKCCPEKAIA
jgi:hypothetical protein